MKKYNVEAIMDNAAQWRGDAPHSNVSMAITGDYTEAETPAEAVGLVQDWIKENLPYNFTAEAENEDLVIYNENGEVVEAYINFTATEIEN